MDHVVVVAFIDLVVYRNGLLQILLIWMTFGSVLFVVLYDEMVFQRTVKRFAYHVQKRLHLWRFHNLLLNLFHLLVVFHQKL